MDPSKMIGERRDRTLEIPYKHSGTSGLLHGRMALSIDKTEEDEVDRRSRTLLQKHNIDRHPNLLRCLGRSDDGETVYAQYTMSLKAFVESNDPPLVQEFKVPTVNCAEDKKLTYSCIPDVYRGFVRGAIDFLIHLHNKTDLSLFELDLERNFVVTGLTLKLWRLRLRINESKEDNIINSQNKDFEHLAKVLRKLFDGQDINIPPDFEHLLSCMENYQESNGDRVLLANHLAVLPSDERLNMIKNLRDNFYFLDSSQKKLYLTLFSTMSGFEDWTAKLDGNYPEYGIIADLFRSPNASYQIDRKRGKPTHWSLNFNAIKFSRDIGEHITPEPDRIKDDPMGKYKQNKKEPFSEHEAECIIMAVFGEHLVNFQMEAKNKGALEWLI